jgi:hypothetical protein
VDVTVGEITMGKKIRTEAQESDIASTALRRKER